MAVEGEFTYPRANLIVSQKGFSVEVRAPSGIRYAEGDKVMDIFAEFLATPEPTIALRARDVRSWLEPHMAVDVTDADRECIIENIRNAFAFKGWILAIE